MAKGKRVWPQPGDVLRVIHDPRTGQERAGLHVLIRYEGEYAHIRTPGVPGSDERLPKSQVYKGKAPGGSKPSVEDRA